MITNDNTFTFSFPSFIREEFDNKLEKLNKRLAKMKDAQPVTILEESSEVRDIYFPVAEGEPASKHEIEFDVVKTSMPVVIKHEGYSFVGTVQMHGDTLSYWSPSNTNLGHIKEMKCDHCGHNRKRRTVHVLNDKFGREKVIGSTCVDEFVGLDVEKALRSFHDFYEHLRSKSKFGYKVMNDYLYDAKMVATAIKSAYHRNPVYEKREVSLRGGFGTRKRVADLMWRLRKPSVNITPSEADNDQAQVIEDEAKNVDVSLAQLFIDNYMGLDREANNFNANVVEALFTEDEDGNRKIRMYYPHKSLGIVVWAAYNALKKHYDALKPTETAAPSGHSFIFHNNHVGGNVGDNVGMLATVVSIKEIESHYGSSNLVTFCTEDGLMVKTFSTAKWTNDIERGDKVQLRGVIKRFEEFKGSKSTLLSWCKVKVLDAHVEEV